MNLTYQTTLPVSPNDIDFSNRLKASAFFNYIQNTAARHAEQLQLGYDFVAETGLFWVISWVKIVVEKYPQYQDSITISTWPQARYKIFSLRDFLFADDQGQIACRARSAWLLVDANTRRIANFNRLPRRIPYRNDGAALDEFPQKLPALDGALPVYETEIRYTDLDINQHTNNAKYVEYLLDSYPHEFHATHRLRSLAISYLSESKYGDRLVLLRDTAELKPGMHRTDAHRLAGRHAADDRLVFQAEVEWKNL